MKIVINDLPPTMNEVIAATKKHWSCYSKLKAEWKEIVRLSTLRATAIVNPVKITYTFILPNNRRRDLDNFYIKAINDGLWFLPDDNFRVITEIAIKCRVEKNIKQTIIEITEIEEIEWAQNPGHTAENVSATSAKFAGLTTERTTEKTAVKSCGKIINGTKRIGAGKLKQKLRPTSCGLKEQKSSTAKTSSPKSEPKVATAPKPK